MIIITDNDDQKKKACGVHIFQLTTYDIRKKKSERSQLPHGEVLMDSAVVIFPP